MEASALVTRVVTHKAYFSVKSVKFLMVFNGVYKEACVM